jgi:hypothetical protein
MTICTVSTCGFGGAAARLSTSPTVTALKGNTVCLSVMLLVAVPTIVGASLVAVTVMVVLASVMNGSWKPSFTVIVSVVASEVGTMMRLLVGLKTRFLTELETFVAEPRIV